MKTISFHDDQEILVWDIFYSGIVTMAHCHPGNGRSNGYAEAPGKLSLEECADIATGMIEIRRKVQYLTLNEPS